MEETHSTVPIPFRRHAPGTVPDIGRDLGRELGEWVHRARMLWDSLHDSSDPDARVAPVLTAAAAAGFIAGLWVGLHRH